MINTYRFELAIIGIIVLNMTLIGLGTFLYFNLKSDLVNTQVELASLGNLNTPTNVAKASLLPIAVVDNKLTSLLVSKNSNESALEKFAPSVVKLVCVSANSGGKLGSGVLYQNSSDGTFYVETNLHVVSINSTSPTTCTISIFPNLADAQNSIVFESDGYEFYNESLDIAHIIPRIAVNNPSAGNQSDLAKYAQKKNNKLVCDSLVIGEHLSILGYPLVGGDTLTITDGIVSGFEYVDQIRYIKTSAKIDGGNSGGVALKDSGCVLGIPTFSNGGQLESIGRVLDLNYFLNNIVGGSAKVSLKTM